MSGFTQIYQISFQLTCDLMAMNIASKGIWCCLGAGWRCQLYRGRNSGYGKCLYDWKRQINGW